MLLNNLGKPVPECRIILDFAAARDDGMAVARLQRDNHQQHTNIMLFNRPDAFLVVQPTNNGKAVKVASSTYVKITMTYLYMVDHKTIKLKHLDIYLVYGRR